MAGAQVHRPGRVGGEPFLVNRILLGFTQQLAHHLTGAQFTDLHPLRSERDGCGSRNPNR
jgi:hypothetical protein